MIVRPLACLLALLFWVAQPCAGEVHLLVDTGAGTLTVFDGQEAVRVFPDIAIGRYGVTSQKRRGAEKRGVWEMLNPPYP